MSLAPNQTRISLESEMTIVSANRRRVVTPRETKMDRSTDLVSRNRGGHHQRSRYLVPRIFRAFKVQHPAQAKEPIRGAKERSRAN